MGILDAAGNPVGTKVCAKCTVVYAGDNCPLCSSRETTNKTMVNIIGILEAARLIKKPGRRSKKRRSGGRVN